MIVFENRDDLIHHYLKPSMIGAELGVFIGEFSRIILKTPISKLYLVDLFSGIAGSGDKDGKNMVYANMDEVMITMKGIYANDVRVELIKNNSHEFLLSLVDNALDFVYIDADHSYCGVKKDIDASFDKIKNGGYIMGHDYVSPRFDGVVRAVNEFCERTNLSIDGLSKCGCPTFCIPVVKK